MKPYPGSPKGPKPEDDPEFYNEWFAMNIPSQFVNYFKSFTETENDQDKDQLEIESDDEDKTHVFENEVLDRQNVEFNHTDVLTSQQTFMQSIQDVFSFYLDQFGLLNGRKLH